MNLVKFPFYLQVFPPTDTFIPFKSKLSFDFLGISETLVKLNRNFLNPTYMPGYNIENTRTEFTDGRTLLYIKQGIIVLGLESTFVEVLEPGMSKII